MKVTGTLGKDTAVHLTQRTELVLEFRHFLTLQTQKGANLLRSQQQARQLLGLL